MRDYSPTACRFLITLREHDYLTSYDPKKDKGPLIFDETTGIYYWNNQYCLEIMLENDLLLTNCKGIKFVKHHEEMCCI
jgi:hypothetical protein